MFCQHKTLLKKGFKLIRLTKAKNTIYYHPQIYTINIQIMAENLIITNVFDDEKMFHIETEEGIVFGLEKRFLNEFVPKVGDRVTLHLRMCSQIIGVDVNDKEVYFLTDEQIEELEKERLEALKEEYRQKFEEDKAILDEMFKLLPKLLQHRIELFRKFIPNFRVEHEDYELSSVFLAYKLYSHCRADTLSALNDNLDKFDIVKYLRTHKLLKTRGISSNQVSFAKVLAISLFKDETELGIDLSSPAKDELVNSFTMNLTNAISVLGEVFCWPRNEYIEKYIQG